MIVQSTRISRGKGVETLARHLLAKPDDNEVIEIIAGTPSALRDAQAFADLKRCRYSLRHLSISPSIEMSPRQLTEFIAAIDTEFGIGWDRPRLVVRHVKNGRSHFHFVVGEVDPVTSRILDCRNDFARLEGLARAYEAKHGEQIQLGRIERRQRRPEGHSNMARKRAERVAPKFNRRRLGFAFATGLEKFIVELDEQGLHLTQGRKCPILVDSEGKLVAAAHRACGVRANEVRSLLTGIVDAKASQRQTRLPSFQSPGANYLTPTSRQLRQLAKGEVDLDELLRRALERKRVGHPTFL